MLASSGAAWCREVRWHGWRALVYVDGRGVKVRTRTGLEVSESLSELRWPGRPPLDGWTAILGGELVACPDGRP
jgi:ATP-dependent DNA ligase